MNSILNKYLGISLSYGFIHSIYHIKDSKIITYIDKKSKL